MILRLLPIMFEPKNSDKVYPTTILEFSFSNISLVPVGKETFNI